MSKEAVRDLGPEGEGSIQETLADRLARSLKGAYRAIRNLANTALSKADQNHASRLIFNKVANLLGKAYIKISGETDFTKVTKFEDRVKAFIGKAFSAEGVELFELLTTPNKEGVDKPHRFFELLASIYEQVVETKAGPDTATHDMRATFHDRATLAGRGGAPSRYMNRKQGS
ncbi:MAG: hypothetical protein WC873_00805 [Candidatus Gracilibacteria bacterium]